MYDIIGQLATSELNQINRSQYHGYLKAMFSIVLELSTMLKGKLSDSIYDKMKKNIAKYPKAHVKKGDESKYTTYSDFTGITKEQVTTQHAMPVRKSDKETNHYMHTEEESYNHQEAYLDNIDDFFMKWVDLANIIQTFAKERGWENDYTVRNLIFCIASELGELSDIVRMVDDSIGLADLSVKLSHSIVDEIADVAIFLMRFALLISSDITMMHVNIRIKPPGTWENPREHLKTERLPVFEYHHDACEYQD